MSKLALLILLCLTAASASPAVAGRNSVEIRGQKQDVYYLPARGDARGIVLYAPGDGGWRGFGITIAQKIADSGYDVYGLDTRVYLESFTTKTGPLKDTDVISDFHALADWIRTLHPGPITLVGWSEGAGLEVLAASDSSNHPVFDGLVTIGLPEACVLGWRKADYITWITKKFPNEPAFQVSTYLPRIAPLPVVFLNSSNDEFASGNIPAKLFSAAVEPKRAIMVQAQDHRFGGNAGQFFTRLSEAIQWIKTIRPQPDKS